MEPAFLADLRAAVGPGALLTDSADLLTYESDALVHLRESSQSRRRAFRLADGHDTVQPDDRRIREPQQLVVPLDDLDPVGFLDARGIGM